MSRRSKTGRPKGRLWTEAEIERLRQVYAEAPPLKSHDLAAELGRTVEAVTLKGSRLGLGDMRRPKVRERKRRRRFDTQEELRAWQSIERKRQQARDGHPRGATGMKHSDETRARIAARMRAAYADPKSVFQDPRWLAARAAKSLTAIHAGPPRGGYSRAAGGKRVDLGDRYFRSAWEANYARYLDWRVARGELAAWAYEAKTFVFDRISRGTRSYTPDFKVVFLDGRYEWHEVKGWMDPKSVTRLNRMRRYFPSETVRVIDEKWFREAYRSGLAAAIPNWEKQGRGTRGC